MGDFQGNNENLSLGQAVKLYFCAGNIFYHYYALDKIYRVMKIERLWVLLSPNDPRLLDIFYSQISKFPSFLYFDHSIKPHIEGYSNVHQIPYNHPFYQEIYFFLEKASQYGDAKCLFYFYYFLSKGFGFLQPRNTNYEKYLLEAMKQQYPDAILQYLYNKLINQNNPDIQFFKEFKSSIESLNKFHDPDLQFLSDVLDFYMFEENFQIHSDRKTSMNTSFFKQPNNDHNMVFKHINFELFSYFLTKFQNVSTSEDLQLIKQCLEIHFKTHPDVNYILQYTQSKETLEQNYQLTITSKLPSQMDASTLTELSLEIIFQHNSKQWENFYRLNTLTFVKLGYSRYLVDAAIFREKFVQNGRHLHFPNPSNIRNFVLGKAFHFYEQASKLNVNEGFIGLALCYFYGRGCSKNEMRAINILERVASSQNEFAKFIIGYFSYFGCIYLKNYQIVESNILNNSLCSHENTFPYLFKTISAN